MTAATAKRDDFAQAELFCWLRRRTWPKGVGSYGEDLPSE
jgi:hypothetical protein